jgi:hypothetical protein
MDEKARCILLGGCLLASEEPRVARALGFDELMDHFTLGDEDLRLLRNKTGPTRLGFALLLKFLPWRGRFPRGRAELPDNAVEHVARQVGVPAADIGLYEWDGRQIKRHRVEIRRALGFHQCSVADAEKLTFWVAGNVTHAQRREEHVRLELLAYCRRERIEPPERTQVDRIVHSALRQAATIDPIRVVTVMNSASSAEAALAAPNGSVREVVFPAVRGGEQTLRELVQEHKANGPVYRRIVATTLKASYTDHYRRGLIRLLEVLEFRSNNSTHRPVIEALELIGRYASAGNLTYYPLAERPPAHRGTDGDWVAVVFTDDHRHRRRTVRMAYEVAAFQALCDQLKCKEIWVLGARKWRNPDEDLPTDFNDRRAEHYAQLRQPLDPTTFINTLREEMRAELAALNDGLPRLGWVDIAERKAGAIRLSPLEADPEPATCASSRPRCTGGGAPSR